MPASVTILHLEDSALDCELACAHLTKAGIHCNVSRVETRDSFIAALDPQRYDLILADFSLPGFDGMEALRIAKERVPQTPFLFLSGRMGEETAVEALKQGARDYVLKHRLARLPAAVSRAIDEARTLADRQRAEESLSRLHQAIDDIRDYAIFTLDLGGRVTSWNEGSRRLFGHAEAEVLDRPLAMLFAPEDRSRHEVDSALAQAAATGRHEVEWRHAARSGRRFWGSCVLTTVRDSAGAHIAYSVVVRDVTERRAAEAALRESEAQFRTITNAMPQLVWTATPDGAPDYFNENWCDYTGLSMRRSVGDGWIAVLHPDDRARTVACWTQSARTGDGYEIEYRLRRSDGLYRWHLGRAQQLRDDAGRTMRWFGTCTDIDDAIAARKALADSRKDLERLVEARTAELVAANDRLRAEVSERERAQADLSTLYAKTPVPLHSLDSQGRLLSVSDRWLEFMGYDDRGQVLGRHVTDFMPEECARLHRDERWPVLLRDGVVRDLPYRFIKRSGEVADILVSARIERDEQGNFLRTMGAIVDVTARLRAEAERERAEEALRHAQKMDALGQLTGGIAHDFNNLLTAITGNLELLIARLGFGDQETLRGYASNAKAGATRAAALTQRLLAFARRQPLRPDTTEPDRLVRGMEDLLRRTVGEQITIEARMAPDVWPAWCDANQLEIALLNLAVNARDAMPAGGRITIAAENVHLSDKELPLGSKPGDYVRLSVGDTGSGMPPDVINRAFDPFFTTKPIGQGTGLGLSQVYGFVNQSHGLVRIESQPGRGTTVSLYLPRCLVERAARPVEVPESVGAPAPDATGADDTAGTILIVEDEALVRMVAVQALEDAGLEVIEASSGAEALELLDGGIRADLMVTDVGMPGMNGRQLAEAVRARRPDLGVLFMTGYAYDATLGTGILEPGCEVLHKPFETGALVARVTEMLAGAGTAPPRAASFSVRRTAQERRAD
ncbi:PAS domain S-box protein [Azospirillum rugosum]|uniref:histidine kinase n=1 Tax=Azospirillum rugosum TaxID=416170 RepID=A0ABS4SX03_9PROT|nr:PAS domain S-box protein [Azospirillum rugosum]MBP2296497.1 PAS domain S-box-containing protein [Azospirillum rugosum]MDQ0530018.1 PAS domain S-box-containing protein [Azospirillum rugosum]